MSFQRLVTAVQDSSVVRLSDSHFGGTETTTSTRIFKTDLTEIPEQSAEAGEKSTNTAELNEIIPFENGKRKRGVGKRKRKPGRPKTGQLSSRCGGLTSQSERDAGHEVSESAFLNDLLDLSEESPTRSGLRGNRKPKVFKDYVVDNFSMRNSSSVDNLGGVKQEEEETSDYEDLEPELAFQCEECDFQTSTKSSLQIHLRSIHHIALKKPKCPLCFRRFVSHRGLKRHRQFNNCRGRPETGQTDGEVSDRDMGEEKFKCNQCDYNSSSLIGLKIHSHIHEERQQRSFSCKLCSKTFVSLKGVALHQRLRCSFLHKRRKNPKRKFYQCTHCGRTCKNRKVLLEHMSTHSDIRSCKCNLCPKTYKTKTSLHRHLQKHRDIFHFCDQCDFKTQWKSSLKTHVNMMHAGEESTEFFKCSHCEYKTKNKFYLKHHENTHSDDRPFVCEICGKASKTQLVHNAHMETHKNCEYPCSKCDYVGRTKMAIYSHQLVHMSRDQMSYKCEQCNWAGKRKIELKMHYRKHSTARLYHCGHCGKSYKHNHGLTRHLKEKHLLDSPEHLSDLEGLASKDEQNDVHDLNSAQVREIIASRRINLEVNSQHLGEAQLLQEVQDAHEASALDQESLQAQASILNSIHVSHIIQSAQGEITQVQGASDISHSTGVDGSRVVSQIVKQYQIIQDSQVIDHPDENLNQDECIPSNQLSLVPCEIRNNSSMKKRPAGIGARLNFHEDW